MLRIKECGTFKLKGHEHATSDPNQTQLAILHEDPEVASRFGAPGLQQES